MILVRAAMTVSRRQRRPAWRPTARLGDGKPAGAGVPTHARMDIGNQPVERWVNIVISLIDNLSLNGVQSAQVACSW